MQFRQLSTLGFSLTLLSALAACSGAGDSGTDSEAVDGPEATLDSQDETDGVTSDGGASDAQDAAAADARADASRDSGLDASRDSGLDASRDSGLDASRDSGLDASRDSGLDASRDSGLDASRDSGLDASRDSGSDTGADASRDASVDADASADASADAGVDADADASADAGVDAGETDAAKFSEVYAILEDRCSGCHGDDVATGSIAFGTQAAAYATLVNRTASLRACLSGARSLVTPGDAADSLLFRKITGTQECGNIMPPRGARLTAGQVAVVASWISAGAKND